MKTHTLTVLPASDPPVLVLQVARGNVAIDMLTELRPSELLDAAQAGVCACLKIAHVLAAYKGRDPDTFALELLQRAVAEATRLRDLDAGLIRPAQP